MTRRPKLLQYSHTFKYLKLNIPAKFASGFPDGEEEMEGRQCEPLCRKECQKCPPQKPQGQEVKLANQNLKKKTPVFPTDISDLPIPLSAKSTQNLYKPHHCGFMEKSQEYGMT